MRKIPPCHLSTSVREGIAGWVIRGELSRAAIDRLHEKIIAILLEKDREPCCRTYGPQKGPLDITEAYFRVRSLPPDIARLPLAVVDLSKDRDFNSFHETTASQIGQSMPFFTDIKTAKAWLRSRIQEPHHPV